jgi:hypothetical protein
MAGTRKGIAGIGGAGMSQGKGPRLDGAKVEVLLDCFHTAYWKAEHLPTIGDEVYCFRCQKPREVMQAPDAYKIKCNGCTYAHRFGMDEDGARIAANRHIAKHQSHSMVLLQGTREVDKFNWSQNTLPDKHGLRETARVNQEILRKIVT